MLGVARAMLKDFSRRRAPGGGADEVSPGRMRRLEGLRAFATLAFAEELVDEPGLLESYCTVFEPHDDATLVISTRHDAEAIARTKRTLAELPMHAERRPHILLAFNDSGDSASSRLAAQTHAVLTGRHLPPALEARPRHDARTILQLHDLAAGEWTKRRRLATGNGGHIPSFCVKICAPQWAGADSWGDLHFARAIQAELERRGHRCLIQVVRDWDSKEGRRYDVAIHLRGLTPYVPKSGQLNVLWVISHPDLLATQECEDYDLVFVASARMRERLTEMTTTPVHLLEQATDPSVFFPDPDPRHHRDLVFVGNSRLVRRPILNDLLPTSHDLAVWGDRWDGLIDPRYVVGRYLPNEEVRRAYSSAAIVLNDHWPDMRREGFISNRIYDALACGALVLSDNLPELHERFPGAIVTYTTRDELSELVDRFLANPKERTAINSRGRELVLGGHTFAHRVDELLQHVLPLTGTPAMEPGRSLQLESPTMQ
jgi:hypothetical protein